MTSTTAELGDADSAGTSNTATAGAATGFNLNVVKTDVNGITFKMVKLKHERCKIWFFR